MYEDKHPEIAHSDMVRKLAKDGNHILATLTADKAHLQHMAIGVSGEAGELLDAVKKHVVYNKPLDVENMIEELGDIEFYLEGVRQALSAAIGREVTREETLAANKNKLAKRYSGFEYTDQKAQDRADKVEDVKVDLQYPGIISGKFEVIDLANKRFSVKTEFDDQDLQSAGLRLSDVVIPEDHFLQSVPNPQRACNVYKVVKRNG